MPPPLPTPAPEAVSIAAVPTPPAPRPVTSEPTPTARAAIAEQAPSAPRYVVASADGKDGEDEEEHTLMRPPTAPLPRDAFRDSLPTEPEPSVGVPLELGSPASKSARSRRPLAWGLVAATLCVCAYVGSRAQQSPAASSPIAPAPASATDNGSEAAPQPPAAAEAKRDDLDPPIGTAYDPDTAAEDDALLSEPARAARKAARAARIVRPARTEPREPSATLAAAEPSAASPSPSEPAAAPRPAAPGVAPQPPAGPAAVPTAAAPSTAPPSTAPPSTAPTAEPSAPVVEPPPAPPGATPPTPSEAEPAPPAVDRENPY